MQSLQFEKSWDITIATVDRNHIIQVFNQEKLADHKTIQTTHLWQAQNHKGDLLVTVIVHNTSTQLVIFENTPVRYQKNEKVIATHFFTLPSLIIKPYTSVPWTFIFPLEQLKHHPLCERGQLVILH